MSILRLDGNYVVGSDPFTLPLGGDFEVDTVFKSTRTLSGDFAVEVRGSRILIKISGELVEQPLLIKTGGQILDPDTLEVWTP